MSAHTPGPWKVIPSPHGREYECVQIGSDERYTTLEMLPADARLIARAPELLARVTALESTRDELVRASEVLRELDRLYRLRFEIAEREKAGEDCRSALLMYGKHKKAAWHESKLALDALDAALINAGKEGR